jgi:NAD(P)-dependent dehydrogenase (short-subunit alcohol dehydrogenase family)
VEAIAETYRYELAPLGIDSVIVEPGLFGTNLAANGVEAEDADRLGAYGELAGRAAEIIGGGRTPGAPQQVADQIADLIETPIGQRPLRTLVGDDTTPLQALNAASDQLAQGALTRLGLDTMLATTPTAR